MGLRVRVHTELLSDCHLASSEPESNPSEILFYSLIRASFSTSQSLPQLRVIDRVQPFLLESEIEGEDTGPAHETPSQAGVGAGKRVCYAGAGGISEYPRSWRRSPGHVLANEG